MSTADSLPHLYLASGSPRRRALLTQIGVEFSPLDIDVAEVRQPNEAPEEYVQRLALDKARAGMALLRGKRAVVLGADTLGVLAGDVLEKPQNQAHAAQMLAAMSGTEHTVLSAVAVVDGYRERLELVQTYVKFRSISDTEIARYWQTGEPKDKAGGYAIQGLGAVFVESIAGSYSAVVGLPLEATQRLLAAYNIPVWASAVLDRNRGES
ncbi:nucleoside triphosphate pyrophosphatase [Gilvimarinus sp. SDUM040013]|uniref:dTTP/UTP pyrophosphatase n=1 Tax=Gilvimarinus gilvus TaxID=3058038 RepID=A0ABU4RSN4_9GAMM|nr:nucleoside triphosphate pyrophosphatase [Gilvimarinus sp. SDUM040013]MDO3388360.1 nucleoside triphosphate pyrophosphatase [Gilvimarinus sp. SDUM040013]MDX6847910.1 nucleoside triphosphate pyrophosphatase [Gilvimarinus sp. SDUM040013]